MSKRPDLNLEGRAAIVVAHPDDETVGAGACLARFSEVTLIHVTDGAPRDCRDAVLNGFSDREEYAIARRRELLNALQAGGIESARTIALGYTDQEASLHLVEIAGALARLLRCLSVDIVLSHPYEGGHPDHDAVAFAVHAACRSLAAEHRPQIVEFTSYHNSAGGMQTGAFLQNDGTPEIVCKLSPEECARKKRMLACFVTQQRVLEPFQTNEERFRPAPSYDFGSEPHDGLLFYEQFPWGMTGARWRILARAAQEQLDRC
jgi:N-acetylglucosamine malate deacetylase 2